MSPEPHVRAQLATAFLSALRFERNPAYDSERHTPSYNVQAETNVEVSDDLSVAVAQLHGAIAWFWPPNTTDQEAPFELSLTITGMFDWVAEGYSREDIEGWITFNAEHLLWPYLRAQVASVTTASDLPPLTIYTIGVPRPRLGRVDEDVIETPGG